MIINSFRFANNPAFDNTYSLDFDGVDDYVNVGNVIDKDKSTAFSISLWVNIPSTITNNIIMSKVEDRDNGGPLSLGGVGYQLYFNNQLYFRFLLDSQFAHWMYVKDANYWGLSDGLINGWHHIVGTYDGSGLSSGMTLYVDGYDVSDVRVDNGTGDFNNTGDLYVGGQNYNATPSISFRGKIDEPCIIPTELTPGEVIDIYNGTRPSGGGAVGGNWNDGTGKPKDMSSYNPDLWLRNGDNGAYKSPQWLLPNNENKDKVSNYSFDFDGMDDYVSVTPNPLTDFTVSFWIKPRSGVSASYDGILGQGTTSAQGGILRYVAYDGTATVGNVLVRLASWTNVSGTVTNGVWTNIILTYDSTLDQLKGYNNGSLYTTISSPDFSAQTTNAHSFERIGLRNGLNGSEFNGGIDEVAVWDSALTDISSIYNDGTPTILPSGAIAHYKMGEEANFTSNWLVDNSALTNYSKRSFAFDGIDGYIDIGNGINFEYTDSFSYSFWVKPDAVSGVKYLYSKYDSGRGILIYLNSSGTNGTNTLNFNLYNTNSGSTRKRITTNSINFAPVNVWTNIVLTYDGSGLGSGISFYKNGAPQGVTVTNDTLDSNTILTSQDAYISGNNFGSSFLAGSQDEWAIYNTELSSGDALAIYNGGEPTTLPSGAVAHWRMGEDASFNGTNWTIPDNVGTNNGTSNAMDVDDLVGEAPNYSGGGISNAMTIEDRVGNAPNSENNALSYNMDLVDRVEDTP